MLPPPAASFFIAAVFNNKSCPRLLQEVEALLSETEMLQGKLHSQEEDFRLQNSTLMTELSKATTLPLQLHRWSFLGASESSTLINSRLAAVHPDRAARTGEPRT